ncbi:hypothetical protein GCM10029992_14780 [Glycomyces albus]
MAIGTAMYTGYRAWTISAVFAVSAFAAISFWQGADRELNADVVRNTLLVVGWLHVAMITGESRRQRDAYMEEAEHTKEEAVRRKAADERVRIARELHDSLTHSISVIRVQAGVAIHLARKRGEQPPEALLAVEEAAKDATSELRETLTMLRGDEGPAWPGSRSWPRGTRGWASSWRSTASSATRPTWPPRSTTRPTGSCRRR